MKVSQQIFQLPHIVPQVATISENWNRMEAHIAWGSPAMPEVLDHKFIFSKHPSFIRNPLDMVEVQ